MPTIRLGDDQLECQAGDNLRRVLLESALPLYNAVAGLIHCRGLGTCGTCAVAIEGPVTEMTAIERWRLSFPPHRRENDLRLACQCQVLGDLNIKKHNGLWGHRVDCES